MAAIAVLPPESPDDCGCDCDVWGHEDCLGQGQKGGTVTFRLDSHIYGVIEISICQPCSDAITARIGRRS